MTTLKLLLLVVAAGTLCVLFARFVLLRFALYLQRRRGVSDEFVTEIAIALPLGLFIIGFMLWIGWLSG